MLMPSFMVIVRFGKLLIHRSYTSSSCTTFRAMRISVTISPGRFWWGRQMVAVSSAPSFMTRAISCLMNNVKALKIKLPKVSRLIYESVWTLLLQCRRRKGTPPFLSTH